MGFMKEETMDAPKTKSAQSDTAKSIKVIRKELADFQEALDKLVDYIKNGPRSDS